MVEQVRSMECDVFHATYLLDTILETVFHGQTVKTVAYLRVSSEQQDLRRQRLAILSRSAAAAAWPGKRPQGTNGAAG